MQPYFRALIDLNKAEKELRSTIERTAKSCNIELSRGIIFKPALSLIQVVGDTAIIDINEHGIVEMRPFFRNKIPIAEGWDIFLAKLTKEIEQ